MPYCPTCKKEYPSGTTICAECNVSLVDNRPADLVSFVSLQNQEVTDRFIAYLQEHDIKAISEYGIRDDVFRIYVNKEDKKTAMKCFISFQASEKRNKNGAASSDSKADSKKAEEEKLAAEKKAEEERIAAEKKAEEERIAAEKAEAERKAEEERIAREKEEAERKAEEERIAREKAEAERKAEEERIAREKAEAERKAEEERIAREKAEAERKAEEERIAREKAEAERKAEEERIAREKAEAERKAEEERIAREKAEAERKAEEERIAREKAEAERKAEEERIAREKAEAERKAEEERIAREKAEAERKAEEERIAREKAEAERKAEEERIAREKAEAERIAAEKKAEEERKAAEKKAEEERKAAEKKAEEERKAAEKKAKEEESHEVEFTANAATRTSRPYYPKKNTNDVPSSSDEFESVFAAKKDNKKRSTLFAEMEKNEEAAAAAATTQDDGFEFTAKRPLTAYQFEKKRQEDLVAYAQEHENAPEPEQVAENNVIDENGKVTISFSDYEQPYEVPTYEDSDPTPVYSDPGKQIDWGAGAEDVADWRKSSSADSEPIFVETERVNNDDIDDDKIIDADISYGRSDEEGAFVSPVNSAQDPDDDNEQNEGGSEDAFSDFLNNFKRASLSKSMKKTSDTTERGKGTYTSSRPTPVAVPEQVKPAAKKPVVADDTTKSTKTAAARTSEPVSKVVTPVVDTIVEDIIPEAKYRNEEDTDYESVPSRPTDIQDTKIKVSFDSDIIEEVIADASEEAARPNIDQSSSFANPDRPVDAAFTSKKPAPHKFEAPEDLNMDDTYRGFVPDYSPNAPEHEQQEVQEVSEFDEFKKKVHARREENQAINAQIKAEATRQANLVKDFGKNGKIVFEDTDDLDNYAGFVPDYTPNTSNEEEFDFYKPHQVSSYAKYKKGTKGGAAGEQTGGRTNGFMRLTSDDEVDSLFISHVPSTAKKVLKPQEIKNANFLINMSGKRLSKLFNSWMMLNVTSQTVRAFEKDGATDAENYENKINGIKKLLTDNFGDLNDIFLESLVQRYYSKFLDE